VIAEAFCQGLPVIASRIGALAEIVDEGRTGLLCWAHRHCDAMQTKGANARKVYEERFSPSINFKTRRQNGRLPRASSDRRSPRY
jgi:glycosyltransferase involved in cell wall biosynthesis